MSLLKNRLENHYQSPLAQQQKISKMARFRNHFDDIHLAIQHGVPLAVILEELNKDNFNITMPTLKSMLQRVRKERGILTTKKSDISNLKKSEIANLPQIENIQSHLNTDVIEANKKAEVAYEKLDARYVYLEEYAHVPRFRKINGDIIHFGETSEEKYYSLGKDPRELKKLSSRQKSTAVGEFLMTVITNDFVYKNIIKE